MSEKTDQKPQTLQQRTDGRSGEGLMRGTGSNSAGGFASGGAKDSPGVLSVMPTSQAVMIRALKYGGILLAILVVLCGSIGFAVDGMKGLWGGIIGALFAAVFNGLTAASIAFANRFFDREFYLGAFFGIVMGGWLLKIVIFFIVALLLQDQLWVNPKIVFVSAIIAIICSLALDVWIMKTCKVPTVSDIVLQEAEMNAALEREEDREVESAQKEQ